MRYSQDFFALQIEYTQKLAAKFGGHWTDYLFNYTTFSKSIGIGGPDSIANPVWKEYVAGVKQAEDAASWTYDFYLLHNGKHDGLPLGQTFHGCLLFGCFYFGIDDGHIIRPHFIKNDPSEYGPLSRQRMQIRLDELHAMFLHVRAELPDSDMVLSNSWMYNLEAYKRLFPPQFTEKLDVAQWDDFQYLARWGQFFDKDWAIKHEMEQEFFDRLEKLDHLESLRFCFPCQILTARCHIRHFYKFYGIA